MTPLTYLGILATLSELINGFWIYVIYTKTSQKMAKFKPFLLRMAAADMAASVSLAWIIQPDVLLPVPAFRVNGLLQYLDSSYASYVGGTITVCSIVGTFTSVLECCIARFIMIFGWTYFLKYMGGTYAKIYLTIIYVGTALLTCIAIVVCIMDTYETALFAENHNLSLYLSRVNLDRDLVYGVNIKSEFTFPIAYAVFALVIAFIGLVFGLSYATQKKIVSQIGKSISKSRYKDQSKLTVLFACQGVIPLLAMILPIFFLVVPWLFHVPSEFEVALTQYVGSTLLISYPLLNSVLSLFLVKPYRVFIKNVWKAVKNRTPVNQIITRVFEST